MQVNLWLRCTTYFRMRVYVLEIFLGITEMPACLSCFYFRITSTQTSFVCSSKKRMFGTSELWVSHTYSRSYVDGGCRCVKTLLNFHIWRRRNFEARRILWLVNINSGTKSFQLWMKKNNKIIAYSRGKRNRSTAIIQWDVYMYVMWKEIAEWQTQFSSISTRFLGNFFFVVVQSKNSVETRSEQAENKSDCNIEP